MLSKIGICTLLAGCFFGLFKGISSFMGSKNYWVDLTVSKIIGEEKSDSIITMFDAVVIQNSLEYLVYDMPFFLFLIGVGVIILAISLFVKDH